MVTIIKIIEKISKISSAMIFVLAFSSVAFVNANTNEEYYEEEKDLYKYNALENKVSFAELEKYVVGATGNAEVDEIEESIYAEWQEVTEKQNFSVTEITKAMNALEDRNEMKTFLVGNNLAVLRFQFVQTREIATLLGVLAEKTEDESLKIQIDNQIRFLQEEQKKVESFIFEQKSEFSLFGWFVNIL